MKYVSFFIGCKLSLNHRLLTEFDTETITKRALRFLLQSQGNQSLLGTELVCLGRAESDTGVLGNRCGRSLSQSRLQTLTFLAMTFAFCARSFLCLGHG